MNVILNGINDSVRSFAEGLKNIVLQNNKAENEITVRMPPKTGTRVRNKKSGKRGEIASSSSPSIFVKHSTGSVEYCDPIFFFEEWEVIEGASKKVVTVDFRKQSKPQLLADRISELD